MGDSSGLAQARAEIGLSQNEVAHFVGVDRAMVSYWESGKRRPNARQIAALSRLYRLDPDQLFHERERSDPDTLAEILYRRAENTELHAQTRLGMRDFTRFLDFYAKLASKVDFDIQGCKHSPFRQPQRGAPPSKTDIQRKAEDVRSHLKLGLGPVPDIDHAAEMLGITIFRADLGEDLQTAASGGFLIHPQVGFAIVVNRSMTTGRQRFTVAHEIAHALFHSHDQHASVSTSHRTARERFADAFAAEFLIPTEGFRRFRETYNIKPMIEDPADVIHIQQYFNTSWAMTLVMLRQMKMVTPETYIKFGLIRPLVLARSLGYEPADESYGNNGYGRNADRWRIACFPRRFLRLVQHAVRLRCISVPTAASHMNLTIPEITQIVSHKEHSEEPDQETVNEIKEYNHVFA